LNKKNKTFYFIFSCVFFASAVFVTPTKSEAKIILNWNKCIELAREKNTDLKTAVHTLETYRYSVKQAYGTFLPEVVAGMDITKNNKSERARNTAISITERFFSGFSDISNLQQKKYQLANSELDFKAAKAELTYNLRAAVAAVLYAKDFLKVSKGIVDRRESNYKKVELLFENGRENRGTLLIIKGLLHRSQIEYEETKDLKVWADKELSSLLDLPIEEDIELDPSVTIASLVNESDRKDQIEMYRSAELNKRLSFDMITSSFDYQKSINNELSSAAAVNSSRSAFFPTLSLTQSYNKVYDFENDPVKGWSLTLSISVPIFNGGQNYYDTRVSLENQIIAVLNKHKAEHDIEKTLLVALKELYRKVDKIKVEKELLDAYELSDKMATEQYLTSFMSFRDWNWAYSDLVEQQLNYFTIQNDLVLQQALVEKLEGKSLLE
jgi:outer membrane protein